MALPKDFIQSLVSVSLEEEMKSSFKEDRPKIHYYCCILRNEIKPVDLYCYLYARFGEPNGLQNFLRRPDTSDNLIHWEWTVQSELGFIRFQGHNFRTEIWIPSILFRESDKEELISQIKADFPNVGRKMGDIRKSFEHWIEFTNPYKSIKQSVDNLFKELDELGIGERNDAICDIYEMRDISVFEQNLKANVLKYSKALGICFGIRSMLPIMAESFVNLLLYVLMKPKLKQDERIRESILRQQIDIRIRTLSHNCIGFSKDVNFNEPVCRNFHSLMNGRNNLLHGNIAPEESQFNELYFNKNVPIFTNYISMWERSVGFTKMAIGLDRVYKEFDTVNTFVDYLNSCLDEKHRELVKMASERSSLGYCKDDGRLGVLFPVHVVDSALRQK